MNSSQLHSLTHPMVRALGWILFGPPLLRSPNPSNLAIKNFFDLGLSTPEKAETRLLELNATPQALTKWLADKPTRRVGHLFEHLVHYWLQFETDAEIIETQKQLFEGDRTIGEIDFLLRFENRIIHIETTIKFYLQTQPNSEWSNFVGPNTKDNLARKTLHLTQKQLPLGSHPQLLEQWNLDSPPESWAMMKGFLFYPADSSTPFPTPDGIDPNHPKGIWTRSNDLPFHLHPRLQHWAILPKPHWIGPSQFQPNSDQVLTIASITPRISSHFESHDAALLMVGLSQTSQGTFEETLRIMVVHPRWPSFA